MRERWHDLLGIRVIDDATSPPLAQVRLVETIDALGAPAPATDLGIRAEPSAPGVLWPGQRVGASDESEARS